MVMVGNDEVLVEEQLRSGGLGCPGCGGRLRPWGHARWRTSRSWAGTVRHRPRRGRCVGCGVTQVLLPSRWLPRRADSCGVIGAALLAKARGSGHRAIAVLLDRPEATVRGWLRRFAARAQGWRRGFTELLMALDPEPGPILPRGSALADAVEAVGLAAAAASRRFGPRHPWRFAATASQGRLLAPLEASAPGVAGG